MRSRGRKAHPFEGFRDRGLPSHTLGVQRLFSTFPNSWPGLGLLILRLSAAFSMLDMARMTGTVAHAATLLFRCVSAVDGALLVVGLWTPFAGIAVAAIHSGILSVAQGLNGASVVNAAVGLALAMLGPGSWSLDARLFGRKRII
jgi:putative oxidoreductase